MRSRGGASHYQVVSALHVASSDMGRDGNHALQQLLTNESCALTSLDLSYSTVDPWVLVQALKENTSLTSLDVRQVPRISTVYLDLGKLLNSSSGNSCRLQFIRLTEFEILEDDQVCSFAERSFDAGTIQLLAGVLLHNVTLRELDLTATDIDDAGASVLAAALKSNTVLNKLTMCYNHLGQKSINTLRSAVPELLLAPSAK